MRMCACRGTAGFAHVVPGGAGEDFGRRARERWVMRGGMRGGRGGPRVVYASKVTTASCIARSGGRAGRRTWGGRRRTSQGLAMNGRAVYTRR